MPSDSCMYISVDYIGSYLQVISSWLLYAILNGLMCVLLNAWIAVSDLFVSKMGDEICSKMEF